jgi:starch synthase
MSLRICFIASEVAPLAKTGGLADVAGALAKVLHSHGHDLRLFMPMYGQVDCSSLQIWPVDYLQRVPLRLGSRELRFDVHTAQLPGASTMIYLIDCPELYDRDAIYTNDADEHLRFIALTHAALICCQRMGFAPDILHCNDWHTALAPLLLKTVFAWDALFARTRSLLTLHNLGYQGVFGAAQAADTGLGDGIELLDRHEWHAGRINPLKEGILHADHISTVSPTYAREIQTTEFGWGLDGVLRQRAAQLTGILNGVDYEDWDPRHDRHLPLHYSPDQLQNKAALKAQLQQRMGLQQSPDRPLLGVVSRMTAQKGFDLLFEALPPLLQARDAGLIVLGSGDRRYEEFFAGLAARWPDRVAFHGGYNEQLAHWIEAGSDIFLMPSLYEPCGLNQLYSLRYGTVPVVRRTGGLADSVQHFDAATGQGTGIVFNDFDGFGVGWALTTALDLYPQKKLWRTLVRNGMAMDYGWATQVHEYETLYTSLLAQAPGKAA